ncbi:MAG: glycosyltransferase family 4 protein [Elusimicrobiota bacterium]
MRICFISAGPFAHVGSYLDHFREAGHDVHFVALSPSPPRSVPTYDVGVGGACAPGRGKWKYPLSMLRARRLVRRLKPDIVHTHYATSGGLAGLVCGHVPTVVTAHGTDLREGFDSWIWRPLLKAVFEQAACVNTVSSDLTGMAVSLGVAPRKIAELTPGVDTARFSPDGRRAILGSGALRLLCTRRLEAVYDPRTIVEALGIVRTRGVDFKMTFAGAGDLREELERLAARLGLGGAVAFAGELRGGEMPGLLREHDVYLSASRADGTSLSLLEAMSAGLFPIVSRIRANEAWLDHGIGGLLHEAGDPEDLAARVLELAGRPSLAASAAGINRARVVAAGDRATNMKRLEAVYEELLGRRRVSGNR